MGKGLFVQSPRRSCDTLMLLGQVFVKYFFYGWRMVSRDLGNYDE